ncbi:hypothetical protein ABPG72_015214 [Tetrahymena utriculariae]
MNAMNSDLCSEASTNSIISVFKNLWINSFFTTQIILFIFACILTIEIIIFMCFLQEYYKIQNPKIQDVSIQNKQEIEIVEIDSQRLLQQENIVSKQNDFIIKKQQKLFHRSNTDILGTLVYHENDFFREAHELRFQNEKQNIKQMSNLNYKVICNQKINSEQLVYKVNISDLRKELHFDEIKKKRQINFITPNRNKEKKSNQMNKKTAHKGQMNSYDSVLYLVANSQSELNTNYCSPRIVSPLLEKKMETDLEEKQQLVYNQNIINNINSLISVFNEDTQQPLQRQGSIETKQYYKSSLEQFLNIQNQQKIYDYLNCNGSIKDLSSFQNKQNSTSKTDLNLKEISYLLQFQNNFANKKSQNDQISLQTNLISSQKEKNQDGQFEKVDLVNQNQNSTKENKTKQNSNNFDFYHEQSKQKKFKECDEKQVNTSQPIQMIFLLKDENKSSLQPEVEQKQKQQNQIKDNIKNKKNIDVSLFLAQFNFKTPIKMYSKRGSLDHFDDYYQEESRVKQKGLIYKKVKFFKRNVNVPKFSKPDFNDIKSRYLAFSSQESLSKIHRCDSSTKSRLDQPTLKNKSKSRLQSLNIDQTYSFQISDLFINRKDIEQKEQNNYQQSLDQKQIKCLQKVEQEIQINNNSNLNNFIRQSDIKSFSSTMIDKNNSGFNQIKYQPNIFHQEIQQNYKLPQLILNQQQQQNNPTLSPSRQQSLIKLQSLQKLKIQRYYHQPE